MKGEAHLSDRLCKCGKLFRPKPMGYNAVFCSKKCKEKFKTKNRPLLRAGAKRSYKRIMLDPTRREARLADGRKSCKNIRIWLAEYKQSRGCVDCGYKANPAALQFDHEGEKTATISAIRSSQARIMAEIESGKCVIRCANCHSVKTWATKNGIKYVAGMAQDESIWSKFK